MEKSSQAMRVWLDRVEYVSRRAIAEETGWSESRVVIGGINGAMDCSGPLQDKKEEEKDEEERLITDWRQVLLQSK